MEAPSRPVHHAASARRSRSSGSNGSARSTSQRRSNPSLQACRFIASRPDCSNPSAALCIIAGFFSAGYSSSSLEVLRYREPPSPSSSRADGPIDQTLWEPVPTHCACNSCQGRLEAHLGGFFLGPLESGILRIGYEHRLVLAATADPHRAFLPDLLYQPPQLLARFLNRNILHKVYLKLNILLRFSLLKQVQRHALAQVMWTGSPHFGSSGNTSRRTR